MLSNLLEKVGQIAANGTSEDLDFNIFQGRMCSEPPSNVITIISFQLSDFHLDPPLYAVNGVKINTEKVCG